MSWRVLLEPDSQENLYCNSVYARDGYLRVQHCVHFNGATGTIIRSTTPGITVTKVSTGLYEIGYGVLGYIDVPYCKAEAYDNSVALS